MSIEMVKNKKNSQTKTLEAVSFQADLQNVLIFLLCQRCELTVRKPSKQARVTTQFQKVKTIKIGDEIIDLQKVVKKRCDSFALILSQEGVKLETIKRRMQPTKRKEAFHFIEDILFMNGIVVTGARDERDGIVGDAQIVDYMNNSVLFTCDQIRVMGRQISRNIGSFFDLYPIISNANKNKKITTHGKELQLGNQTFAQQTNLS
ncbi:hypothetical protein EIN_369670 [Entamoeba invadens IP1]|uniref:Uncharacterized protein n=1 Tax=Entamoeba invadens IP1 TaxID=370355 RepID=A0A0A1UBQ9_ENTIV|nr:hypothetical protein EIN_369670 [Entamoeba invadens IP1]ELP92645.1 hypothetical protein EIN_369670 [Entamoeba invadens IP1]|eukprot:XP_004259416.1 hypothetical protein EIN_369670 [Entamoeba invadens IP1]